MEERIINMGFKEVPESYGKNSVRSKVKSFSGDRDIDNLEDRSGVWKFEKERLRNLEKDLHK